MAQRLFVIYLTFTSGEAREEERSGPDRSAAGPAGAAEEAAHGGGVLAVRWQFICGR